ncbi:ankyrin repeat and protein kinase domain-containing protein 1-like [Senna tora]|uniref:Ankyrin repeat and protein kinase domain-containing protein 1-like n=1 Tax=Senna tora TaxID=362788 RepID=A0A834TE09_9FABA|nr:ankyrin repeat and protein kinase domain-containing protein 1-like [Senna tora]
MLLFWEIVGNEEWNSEALIASYKYSSPNASSSSTSTPAIAIAASPASIQSFKNHTTCESDDYNSQLSLMQNLLDSRCQLPTAKCNFEMVTTYKRLDFENPSNIVAIRVEAGQKCVGHITLRNVMYTMPVAYRLQPMIKTRYTVKPQSGIISPLATLTIEIVYHLPPAANLPHSFPHCDDSFLLHSVVVPGAAIKEPSSMFDVVPIDWFTTKKKQVFIDSGIKIMFVGSSILAQLVAHGSMDEIREVLERSDPSWKAPDSMDSQGQTLLHLAISQSRPDLVQLLLEFEPDIETPSRSRSGSGSTPLEDACASGEALIVELLLAHKATTERSESSFLGPIHLATKEGHMDVMRLLLLKGAKVDSQTKDGNTALHIAVQERRRDCARLLLANGARTDLRNARDGDTPLHIAAAMGDENMVKLLLQKGSNKDVRNGLGKTAYDVAAENGHTRLFDALKLGDSLCVAARKGEVRTIQKLLEAGAAINGKDQHGWTALHRAAFKGRIDVVRALVEKGVDVDAKDEDGYTALHCAAESGHADVTEMLVKKGGDVEARTNKGVTALQIAESLHYVGITRILVNGGASRESGGQIIAPPVIPFGNKMEGGEKKKKKTMMARNRGLRGSFDRSPALAVV